MNMRCGKEKVCSHLSQNDLFVRKRIQEVSLSRSIQRLMMTRPYAAAAAAAAAAIIFDAKVTGANQLDTKTLTRGIKGRNVKAESLIEMKMAFGQVQQIKQSLLNGKSLLIEPYV